MVYIFSSWEGPNGNLAIKVPLLIHYTAVKIRGARMDCAGARGSRVVPDRGAARLRPRYRAYRL